MNRLISVFILLFLLVVSCKEKNNVAKTSDSNDSTIVDSTRIISTVNITLMPAAKKDIDEWQEYNDLDEFIIRFYNISNSEALSNAKELADLVKKVKDSFRVDKLNKKNLVARVNVLENEALRLADMAEISSISEIEVKEEVLKIIEIYDALNSKINTIYKAEALQKSLDIDTEIPLDIKEEKALKMRRKVSTNKEKISDKIPAENKTYEKD